MRKFFSGSLLVAAMMVSMSAMAEDKPVDKHPWRFGFGMQVGIPVGAAIGIVVHPKVDWIVAQASVTYNGLAPGEMLSLTIDPMALAPNLPFGLFVEAQAGWALSGTIPGHSDLPSLSYHYANFYGGLRFGKSKNFNWVLMAGPSYLSATTGNFGSVVGDHPGLTYSDPRVSGWVMPTVATGFRVVW